ncbi:MAG: nucleotidyltransferase domain-containing protein [Sulfurimonas sp.]|nr:nucleotidyltransferase domain-containing protein [Sulfurimonas sp.]
MRLSVKEIDLIKGRVKTIFGETVVRLFGSRIDDTKQGGDIDLYIVPVICDNLFQKKMSIKTSLEDVLCKPVDIVLAKGKRRPIEIEAMKGIIL